MGHTTAAITAPAAIARAAIARAAIARAAIALGLLTLTGCTQTADPTEPPTPPTTSTTTTTSSGTPTPTPAPRPTPPAIPQAATAHTKAHTKAGARAFVKYFWDVVNYAENTGDVEALNSAFVPGCAACEGGVAGIEQIYREHGRISGGEEHVDVGRLTISYAGPFTPCRSRYHRDDAPATRGLSRYR